MVKKLIVHHTGTPNDITDYPGLARGIFKNEVNNGYIDIAYNWLIDPNGRIYEGRWAHDYPAGIPHTGERNHLNVRGAHALYFNDDTIGIGLMGDYRFVAPNEAMVRSLLTLLTWKCARWGIDPLGKVPYVDSQGTPVVGLANICGHQDTYATACPGATVETMLPSLRTQVAFRLAIGATGYWVVSGAGQVDPVREPPQRRRARSARPARPRSRRGRAPDGPGLLDVRRGRRRLHVRRREVLRIDGRGSG